MFSDLLLLVPYPVFQYMAMARIRLGDKFNRFKTLSRGGEQKVNDESIRDTLIDLANYAIMTVVEMEAAKHDAE